MHLNTLALRLVLLAGLPALVSAQTVSVPPEGVPLRPVVASQPAQPAPPTYELAVKWNDKLKGVDTVPLANTSDQPLHILGVQSTGGVFVGDFPTTVSPGKEEQISIVYNSLSNASGDVDLIRVLTDQGVKEIRIQLTRGKAVSLSAKQVAWTVGDSPQAKTVVLTVTADTVKPTSVRTTADNVAVLTAVDATTWNVQITPGSTAKSGKFPVFVNFDHPMAGGNPVILGIIQPKE